MENNNVISIPKTSTVFKALFRADIATQISNRRSVIITFLVPLVILIAWKGAATDAKGAVFALSTALGIGLISIGLMGYSLAVARDRDKGVFQRLRVAPAPAWAIMVSRIGVQLLMISILTIVIFIVGFQIDKITLSGAGYLIAFCTAFLGGALYLSLGQMIVGLVKSFETVNAVIRLVYFLFIMIGTFGDTGLLGIYVKHIVRWSPYGSVKIMMAASMDPSIWDGDATRAVLLSIGYAIIFAVIGISKFKWSTK